MPDSIEIVILETLKGLLEDPRYAAVPANAKGFLQQLIRAANTGFEEAEGLHRLQALRRQIGKLPEEFRQKIAGAVQAYTAKTLATALQKQELLALLRDPQYAVIPLRPKYVFERIQEIRLLGPETETGFAQLQALKLQLQHVPDTILKQLYTATAKGKTTSITDKLLRDELLQFFTPSTVQKAAIISHETLQSKARNALIANIFE